MLSYGNLVSIPPQVARLYILVLQSEAAQQVCAVPLTYSYLHNASYTIYSIYYPPRNAYTYPSSVFTMASTLPSHALAVGSASAIVVTEADVIASNVAFVVMVTDVKLSVKSASPVVVSSTILSVVCFASVDVIVTPGDVITVEVSCDDVTDVGLEPIKIKVRGIWRVKLLEKAHLYLYRSQRYFTPC